MKILPWDCWAVEKKKLSLLVGLCIPANEGALEVDRNRDCILNLAGTEWNYIVKIKTKQNLEILEMIYTWMNLWSLRFNASFESSLTQVRSV